MVIFDQVSKFQKNWQTLRPCAHDVVPERFHASQNENGINCKNYHRTSFQFFSGARLGLCWFLFKHTAKCYEIFYHGNARKRQFLQFFLFFLFLFYHLTCTRVTFFRHDWFLSWVIARMTKLITVLSILGFHVTSWISLGVNSKSIHSHRRQIVFYCRCWPCVWQQIRAISWDFFTSVQHNHQYILGWPPLRLTAKYPSETQELSTF